MSQHSRRDFLKVAGAGTATLMAAGLPDVFNWQHSQVMADPSTQAATDRPNVIVCMVDDMGFSDPGCFGGEIKTPNLDKLAANGVRFSNFHNTSRCCPSRASILTGLYPQQTGMGYMTKDTKHPGYRGAMINPCVTMAEALAPAGYQNSLCGKWHVEVDPRKRGFQTCDNWFAWGATSFFYPFDKDGIPQKPTDPSFYATDFFADGVVNHIKKQSSDNHPFFIYWTPTAPHYPIHAKEEDVKKYRDLYKELSPEQIAQGRYDRLIEMGMFTDDQPWSIPEIVKTKQENWWADYRLDTDPLGQKEGYKAGHWKSVKKYDCYNGTSEIPEVMAMYAAMMDRFDQGLGRVLKTLEETGEFENTLIMFCSDNGCSGERPNIGLPLSNAANTPFLKTKKSAYNGGLGTPMIMHWPKQTTETAKGSINRSWGHLVDVMPTVLAATGASYPEQDHKGRPTPAIEGRSLLDTLQGQHVELNQPIFVEHAGNAALITEAFKMTSDRQEPWRLFDMKKDRFERNDIAAQHPEKIKSMAAHWDERAKKYNALRGGQPKTPKKPKQS